jgi:ABC-type multidrug transport system fused ATPase/permease subunit
LILIIEYSVRRIESYLDEDEVTPPPTNLDPQAKVKLGFANATISWSYVPMFPEDSVFSNSSLTSLESSEITRFESSDSFVLHNLTADFPNGKLSIICGATGSGKTLMMMSLLRETTLLDGKIFCPRAHVVESLTDELDLDDSISEEDWILDHGVAYVSQTGKSKDFGERQLEILK